VARDYLVNRLNEADDKHPVFSDASTIIEREISALQDDFEFPQVAKC
jgi:hypothetical protein